MSVIDQILAARYPEDVFGTMTHRRSAARKDLTQAWRNLSREVHPDLNADPRASEAQARLNEVYQAALRAVALGTYGAGSLVNEVVIRTKRHAYKVSDLYARGETANVYRASYEDEGKAIDALIKVARRPKDNGLLANEARTLKTLLADSDTYDLASPFLPGYIETFGYRNARKQRQAIAFKRAADFVTLERVRAAYPNGIHPKDMAWMFRRLMWVLGFAHAKGIVHGAVLPRHVLILPAAHGLMLVDWKAAVPSGQRVKVASTAFSALYPEEVTEGRPALPGTDIFLAVRCMEYLLEGRVVPPRLRAFFKGCTQRQANRRPQEAWDLHDEFTDLIKEMWGPLKFRPFHMAGT